MTCVRSIKFTIPGNGSAPDVEVYVEEQNGSLVFTVTVLSTPTLTADLRGLFFNVADDSQLTGLTVSEGDKVTDFDTHDVIDLGNGANMRGKAKPFDAGLEFGTQGIGKDDIQTATFTLTNADGDLTLDDIAQMEFGARLTSIGAPDGPREGSAKLTVIAPAAPDAVDDSYPDLFEDGASGLGDPSKTPQGILLHVLANDTDADGDTLTITGFDGGPLHGTVQIVDGDDADLDPGDAILYTPDLDYAGDDSFIYCITDNNGGTDFAEVTLTMAAVADVPLLSYEVIAGAAVNEIIVRVTATQNDADSSEFIDRILLSVDGGLPAGTIVPGAFNPGTEPDQIVQDFLITVPLDQDTSYTLDITAWSKETSNGDEESNTVSLDIVYEYNSNSFDPTFLATDQSIWQAGDQYVLEDNRFIGVDVDPAAVSGSGFITYEFDAALKAGFQSNFRFEGGEIDANLPYDITIDTNYNKTTDMLVIGSSAALTGGGFTTEGPEGSYVLDFIFNYYLRAKAGLDLPSPADDWFPIDITLGSNNTANILDVTSDEIALEFDLPIPGLTASIAWPQLDTTSDNTNVYEASGASNNFFQLNLDVDQFAFGLFGLPSLFELNFSILGGAVYANLDLIDLDLFGGLNFLQAFDMAVQGLPGTLHFEDGTSQNFIFGNDVTVLDASDVDAAGNNDGDVDFTLTLDPDVSLTNNTDLGFNVGYLFTILKLVAGYDLSLDLGLFDVDLGSDEVTIGPLFQAGGTLPLGSADIYDATFALNFGSQDLVFAA
ncbi:Ig-like domain-containing protein [Falsiroseomonas sp.]|uniref:Ig-like domain-containing protein n=1 Tax=Falsiroseomonas sp. TaxID=2870721 RepID=UPI00356678F5